MLTRKPRKGDRIIYNDPHNDDPPKIYVVMGKFRNHDDLINIATPESYVKDGGHNEHTQVIWNHSDGPNPWLTFEVIKRPYGGPNTLKQQKEGKGK